jgi:hypothetical protein
MKRLNAVGLALVLALAAVGAPKADFGAYKEAYTERMKSAASAKEIVFLSTRYDDALAAMQAQLAKAGLKEEARAVLEERKRIRSLEKVMAAKALGDDLEDIAVDRGKPIANVPVQFFGIEETCSNPVFLIPAGPSVVMGSQGSPAPQARMTFHILRNRVADAIESLPEQVRFNTALYWAANTTPIAPEPLAATPGNKWSFTEWSAPVNPLNSSEYYGYGLTGGACPKWPVRKENGIPAAAPLWLYDYQVNPALEKHYEGDGAGFISWARALCFAFEQKADVVFLIANNNIFRKENQRDFAEMMAEAASSCMGKGQPLPRVNVILVSVIGRSSNLSAIRDEFKPLVKAFDGKIEMIDNLERWMTDDEEKLFDSL